LGEPLIGLIGRTTTLGELGLGELGWANLDWAKQSSIVLSKKNSINLTFCSVSCLQVGDLLYKQFVEKKYLKASSLIFSD